MEINLTGILPGQQLYIAVWSVQVWKNYLNPLSHIYACMF